MKSAEEWIQEFSSPEVPVGAVTVKDISEIQADATADLQSQVEQLTVQKEWCLKEMTILTNANNLGNSETIKLRTALDKCVAALESEPFHSWRVKEALNTAKPLLNKP